MKKLSLFLILAVVMLMWRCSKEMVDLGSGKAINCSEEPGVCRVGDANNNFGFDIFRLLQEKSPEENLFISPISIGTAFAMALNGADGPTREEMQQTMNISGEDLRAINASYRSLLRLLPGLDPQVKLSLANSIWYRKGYPVLPAFLDTCRNAYQSEVQALDFASPEAVKTINGWVDSKTNGLIDGILDEIPSDAVMYLINAIYFKGAWTKTFDKKKTYESPFNGYGKKKITVQMMNHGEASLPYFENDLFQSVDLGYGKDSLFSMSIFLPKEGQTVGSVVEQLNAANWKQWSGSYRTQPIFFSMPRFEMAYEKKLNEVLQELGMKKAFTGAADFSKMVRDGGVYIDEVRHKAFIKVNEEGTEAAAVTSIGIVETSAPDYPVVTLDRPFLFMIRERGSNAVLFIGHLADPSVN